MKIDKLDALAGVSGSGFPEIPETCAAEGHCRGCIGLYLWFRQVKEQPLWYTGKLFCLYIVVSVTILAESQIETVWDSNP